MLNSVTKKKIDNARDILVGKIPMPTTQVEQITLALIYKFMGDMDKRAKALGDTNGFFAHGYEQYSWDRLMDKSLSARERVKLYGEGLEKMSVNPHIPQLFRDIFRNAFLPFNDPETLKLFLDQIDQFSYDHSEELGNAFEYLLSVLGSQGDAGQFRTPRHIIDFIVEVVEPTIDDRILDPACGTAGFLISAFKYLQKQGLPAAELKKVTDHVVGYDISHDMVRLSLVNLYLHQFPNPHVYEYDSLTSEDRWDDSFDCILANPPFMSPKGGIRPHSRFAIPSNRSEVLFVDYIMEHLSINGKAGVIVPEGIIFQSQNAYKNLRKMMVEENFLWAVVSLPSGVFQPYSGVKTSILFFDKEIARKNDFVLFVKVASDGFDLGAQRREIVKNDLPEALNFLKQYKESGVAKEFAQILLSETSDTMVNLVKKDLIAKFGDYNLSSERYRDNVIHTNTKWPMLELGEITHLKKGSPITKKDTVQGNIPVIAGGQSPAYYHNQANRTGRIITVSASGAYAGFVNYFETPIFASDCTTVEPKDIKKLDAKYLFWMMRSKQDEIYRLQQGGGQPHVYSKDLSRIKIPLPPLSVQQEIVEELDRYQRIIDGAKQVVVNYKANINIQGDWEWKPLSDFCNIQGGHAFKSDGFVSEGVQLIRMGNVKQDFFDQTNKQVFLPKIYLEKYTNYALTRGDIIISMTGTVGKDDYANVCRIDKDSNYLLNQRVSKLVIDVDKVDPDYFYLCVISPFFKKQVIANSSGGVRQANVSATGIAKATIPFPPLDVQKEIALSLNSERKIVDQNNILITAFEIKIKSRIAEICGVVD